MKTSLPFALLAFLGTTALAVDLNTPMPASTPPPARLEPGALQREFIGRGYGMFIHFGINTFNETEWSYGKLPVESYNPTALDCDQWIRVAKEAGFRHVVLTTKHVDGFCLWDSALTDYDVGASPVKTDIVAEVAKACQKYGVKLGLYYSLWDTHEPTQANDMPRYVAYMKGQLTELLTRYGPVCELWFDAPWATPRDSDWCYPELRELIHQLQPGCAVTVNHTVLHAKKPRHPSLPVDFAHGSKLRFWPVDFRAKDPDLVRSNDPKIYTAPDESQVYLPFEHTVCISDLANWFQKKNVRPAPVAPYQIIGSAAGQFDDQYAFGTAQEVTAFSAVQIDFSAHNSNADIFVERSADVEKWNEVYRGSYGLAHWEITLTRFFTGIQQPGIPARYVSVSGDFGTRPSSLQLGKFALYAT